ncbi:sialidase family protein [Dyadobacter sp. LHD-138]|uniref:WD40/YVTN/BNR-like repeat-containing protein n=1 Tax=Dyadobacter sp. LHD-138 TaxID=3071413 RepID=UPI0027E13083|nr:sialidase family protein [Dyadobacter sp. LHD-138]MDQ6476879.1 sialidase family protein [Dyadobacter sp. LHD-138]
MKIHSLAFLLLFQFSFAFDQALEFPQSSSLPDSKQKQKRDKAGAANIIFKSTDDGQTWQDISEGLPENLSENGIPREGFYANDNGIYLHTGNEMYHSKANSRTPFWEKEISPDNLGSIVPGRTGMLAFNYSGQFLQKINGTSVWSPIYTNFPGKGVRTVFKTAGGTVFICSDSSLSKSTDGGETWKHFHTEGWVRTFVESNGVLLATSQRGIIRSTDDGESWESVISEGGVGITVERIKGGFAAITCNTETETRRVRTSYDGGKTWQPIDADLPPSLYIASITEVGAYMFCGHPAGIYRSSDKGKTWQLLLPAIQDKVFNLSVSGNVIYAIPRGGGC